MRLPTFFRSFPFHAPDEVDVINSSLSELEKLRLRAFKLMKEHRSEGEWAANSPDISAIENIFGGV